MINNISKDKAKVIVKALEPDNVDFPQGLNLEIKEKEEPAYYFIFQMKET